MWEITQNAKNQIIFQKTNPIYHSLFFTFTLSAKHAADIREDKGINVCNDSSGDGYNDVPTRNIDGGSGLYVDYGNQQGRGFSGDLRIMAVWIGTGGDQDMQRMIAIKRAMVCDERWLLFARHVSGLKW
ncbi:hypothetical protein F2Q68_00015803 [Brassica cretica]|uniref:Uncharacterized protein n=1 Tax=Brassica cretica TaxID=69181 RepID=A0A8S9HNK3_BRACR|nr:hypothetical protein F2Q68_00015803 [Brassica cretica]